MYRVSRVVRVRNVERSRRVRGRWVWGIHLCGLALLLGGCVGETPSKRHSARLPLPSPTAVDTIPTDERLSSVDRGEHHQLSPKTLITIAFNRQPDVKSSYQKFRSEEARYDFFYASNDSLTPKLSLQSKADEYESPDEEFGGKKVDRSRQHTATLSMEKRFFDTSQVDLGLGYDWEDESDDGYGGRPFASADIRYPLWASRERLERTSEEIFRRNELNDAQLAFIKTVRARMRTALNHYYSTIHQRELHTAAKAWREDLEALAAHLDTARGQDTEADRRKIEAEITSVSSREAGNRTFTEVFEARLKSACGLPFHARIELEEMDFAPFRGMTHESLCALGIQTDPEIATLRNARDNATVQLDLARRGRWDVALLLSGETNLAGRGTSEGNSDWAVSVGLDVASVDPRVTRSLIRQASADIERYTEAMAARENTIFVNTLEPQRRNAQLAETKLALEEALPQYRSDYEAGVQQYLAGEMNIDDLLERRTDLYAQEEEVSRQAMYMGFNTSALCAETGKFFELLNGDPAARGEIPDMAARELEAANGNG